MYKNNHPDFTHRLEKLFFVKNIHINMKKSGYKSLVLKILWYGVYPTYLETESTKNSL